jgi:hypothetical protein
MDHTAPEQRRTGGRIGLQTGDRKTQFSGRDRLASELDYLNARRGQGCAEGGCDAFAREGLERPYEAGLHSRFEHQAVTPREARQLSCPVGAAGSGGGRIAERQFRRDLCKRRYAKRHVLGQYPRARNRQALGAGRRQREKQGE